MRDAVVLDFTDTLTSSTSTRPSKELTDVRKNEDLWWCCAGGDTGVARNTVQAPASGAGLDQGDMGYGNSRGNCKIAGDGGVPPPAK